MFRSVLVANRGEIAVRIVRTLRRMGIRSVVVASIPDRTSLAVRTADASVLLEGYRPAETYLDIEAVLNAARAAGCDAIHPGYGFLSERADFVDRCVEAGITFIGPPAAVLRGMGDKSGARQLASANDVPVVPGWDGADDDATLMREASRIGTPIMVKARGGGGGRGMREVFGLAALPEAIASARREATSAFGDGGLLIEKLVTGAHHVEVQVFADNHGNVIHLGERDCSVQRRHQKLVEESPSPVVDDRLRGRLTEAALRLARAIRYVNAGTFEFLVGEPDTTGERPIYFLEVNPRLQVEHPVTEMVTGLDLVELQVRIAAGEALPIQQADVRFNGHAIEYRINAEDPRHDFRPASGHIAAIHLPASRFDTGFAAGDTVPSQFDSLLGKAIVHAPSREEAIAASQTMLASAFIQGIETNLRLHRAVAGSQEFGAGTTTIEWLEPALGELLDAAKTPWSAIVAAAVALAVTRDPGFQSLGWIGAAAPGVWLGDGMEVRQVSVATAQGAAGRAVLEGVEQEFAFRQEGSRFLVTTGGSVITVEDADGAGFVVTSDGSGANSWRVWLVPPPPIPRPASATMLGATLVIAPLAGTIASVNVSLGDAVEEGAVLATLEAMKMEHRITANASGTIGAVHIAERDVVREGDPLFELA